MPIITPAYPCMNSSYNVSISTLRVMMEQFQFANKICEEIELNKAQWSSLFKPYFFFESYRNYLQVDIVAADVDDLRAWRGWVESRLRQLTLMIERDTYGKLQCHPYPHEYVDPSKQCSHNAFFMGLQRKQGEVIQEGQQFDIRETVDEFKHSVNMYMFWKPGMEIAVHHVRRKQIPSYVFPDGYRRCRPQRLVANTKSSPDRGERLVKRKNDSQAVDNNKSARQRTSLSPQRQDSVSPEIVSLGSCKSQECSTSGKESTEVVASNNLSTSGENGRTGLNSSVVSSEASVGIESGGGSCVGSDNEGCLMNGDMCEAVSEFHIENGGCLKGKGGGGLLQSNTAAFEMVINSMVGVETESVQKPVMRMSLTSTA